MHRLDHNCLEPRQLDVPGFSSKFGFGQQTRYKSSDRRRPGNAGDRQDISQVEGAQILLVRRVIIQVIKSCADWSAQSVSTTTDQDVHSTCASPSAVPVGPRAVELRVGITLGASGATRTARPPVRHNQNKRDASHARIHAAVAQSSRAANYAPDTMAARVLRTVPSQFAASPSRGGRAGFT